MINNCLSLSFSGLSFSGRWIVVLCMVMASGLHAADVATGDFSDKTGITQRLQQVQIELLQHASDSDPLTLELLERLETTLYHHLAAVDLLIVKSGQREQAEELTRDWKGFDQPGPYPISFSDDLRMQLIEAQHVQRAAEVRLRLITEYKDSATEQFTDFQSTERQFIEMLEMSDDAESRKQALMSLQQNAISLRTAAEKVAYVELRQHVAQAVLGAFQAGQELVELQLKSIEGQAKFSRTELDEILLRITTERALAIETLDSPDDESQEANAQVAWLAEFLDVEEQFWNTRYLAMSTASLKERKKALDTFRELSLTIDAWDQVGKTLASDRFITRAESVGEQELRDDLQRIKVLRYRVDFAISEQEDSIGFGGSLLNYLLDAAVAIWSSELYLVEDSASIEGEKVTTYRAITVGKLIQLAFILIAGWLTLKFLSRRVRLLAIRYTDGSPDTVNSIARWTFGMGIAVLIIYGLKTVNIPFTAFAFLGGTLAIGIGFGAQTLIKNFISGIILILERPFKVGDLIEVDQVTGQILRIGMRASVIEHFDGIETLVPNSVLLDNRVDNWTFGKTAIRGSVSVGVAYGSPTREVSKTLLAAALEHGQVLDRPEPEVRFEEFGDSSLVFRLLYWVNATKVQRERVNSDLRYMIDKALLEAEIIVAYPQRDLHFDPNQPLRVEVSSSAGQTPPPKRRRVTD